MKIKRFSMKILLKALFIGILMASVSCKKTEPPPFTLEGSWRMSVKISKSFDWRATEQPPTQSTPAIIDIELSVINDKITGKYISTSGACVNTELNGTINTDNTFEIITTASNGTCCNGAKMKMVGNLTSNDTFNATFTPINTPPFNCYIWWAEIGGTRIK
jgi:hypothetical protein